VAPAVAYAKSLEPHHVVAVTVGGEDERADRVKAELWDACDFGVPLENVPSPFRDLSGAVMEYLEELDERWEDDVITVVIPEFVVQRWWQQLLHNQSALALKLRLLVRPNTVVISVPFHLDAHFHALDRLEAEHRGEEEAAERAAAKAPVTP
jgi:hypothetical protein